MRTAKFVKRALYLSLAPLLLTGMVGTGASPVQAQDMAADDYKPKGLPLGSFRLFPKMSVSEVYNDNIYSTATGEEEDFITKISPSLDLRSNFSQHMLNLKAGASVGLYMDNSDEDYEDYNAEANGRVDITRAAKLELNGKYEVGHDDRSDPDDANGKEPTEWDRQSVGATLTFKPNKLSVAVGGKYEQRNWDDVETSAGTLINNDDRDRESMNASVRVGYEYLPSYEIFASASYVDVSYDDAVDDNNIKRDSDGYRFSGGVKISLTDLLNGEVGGGYFTRSYEDASFDDNDGYHATAQLTWTPSRLTTVRGNVSRVINETTTNNASGYVTTRFGGSVSHDIRRNITLEGNASFANDDYDGITREDDTVTVGVGATYKINRNFNAGAKYQYKDKDSDNDTSDYTENTAQVSLTVQF